MQKIRFIKSNFEYDVSLKMQSNRISIMFLNTSDATNAPLSEGFVELNEHNSRVQSDFSDYIYIYKAEEDGVTYILTKDENDVYVEPVEPEYKPPEPYVQTLEEMKNNKINEIHNGYQNELIIGTDVVLENETKHFSLNQNVLSEVVSKSIEIQNTTNKVISFNNELFSIQDMRTIIYHINYFVESKKAYRENLCELVNEFETENEVNDIYWGMEITSEKMNIVYSAYINGDISPDVNYARVVDNAEDITQTEMALVEVYELMMGGV